MLEELLGIVRDKIADDSLRVLVEGILTENRDEVLRMPAARHNHHAFVGGLLEHTLSVTRTAIYLAEKYAAYYPEMQPPLDTSLVVAGAILHDIGKLRELDQRPEGTIYTPAGALVGHLLMGRDIRARGGPAPSLAGRDAVAAGAPHHCAPAAARVGLAQAAHDARGPDRPLLRRHGREVLHDGRDPRHRHQPGAIDLEEERADAASLSRARDWWLTVRSGAYRPRRSFGIWRRSMNRPAISIMALGLLLPVVGSDWAAEANREQASAIAEITRLGGKATHPDQAVVVDEVKKLDGEVVFDNQSSGKAVVGIALKKQPATDATLALIINGCPHLRSLTLWSPEITDAGVANLKSCAELEKVDFEHTDITDAGLKCICELPNLQTLILEAYKVTDAGMQHLARKTKLQRLEIWSPLITDDGLSDLRGLVNLKELNIGGTRATDSGLKYIEGLRKLERLSLNRATTTLDWSTSRD